MVPMTSYIVHRYSDGGAIGVRAVYFHGHRYVAHRVVGSGRHFTAIFVSAGDRYPRTFGTFRTVH